MLAAPIKAIKTSIRNVQNAINPGAISAPEAPERGQRNASFPERPSARVPNGGAGLRQSCDVLQHSRRACQTARKKVLQMPMRQPQLAHSSERT